MSTRQYIGPFTSQHPVVFQWGDRGSRLPLDGNLIYVRFYVVYEDSAQLAVGPDAWRRIGEVGSDTHRLFKYRRQWNTGDSHEIRGNSTPGTRFRVRIWELNT